jgi:hypothetical protein
MLPGTFKITGVHAEGHLTYMPGSWELCPWVSSSFFELDVALMCSLAKHYPRSHRTSRPSRRDHCSGICPVGGMRCFSTAFF